MAKTSPFIIRVYEAANTLSELPVFHSTLITVPSIPMGPPPPLPKDNHYDSVSILVPKDLPETLKSNPFIPIPDEVLGLVNPHANMQNTEKKSCQRRHRYRRKHRLTYSTVPCSIMSRHSANIRSSSETSVLALKTQTTEAFPLEQQQNNLIFSTLLKNISSHPSQLRNTASFPKSPSRQRSQSFPLSSFKKLSCPLLRCSMSDIHLPKVFQSHEALLRRFNLKSEKKFGSVGTCSAENSMHSFAIDQKNLENNPQTPCFLFGDIKVTSHRARVKESLPVNKMSSLVNLIQCESKAIPSHTVKYKSMSLLNCSAMKENNKNETALRRKSSWTRPHQTAPKIPTFATLSQLQKTLPQKYPGVQLYQSKLSTTFSCRNTQAKTKNFGVLHKAPGHFLATNVFLKGNSLRKLKCGKEPKRIDYPSSENSSTRASDHLTSLDFRSQAYPEGY